MKNIIILQNSYLSFSLDVEKIYQPSKYNIFLIVNNFGYDIVVSSQHTKYYNNIIVTNNFEFENILSLVQSCLEGCAEFDIVTNSEETMRVCGKIRLHFGLETEDYSRFYDKHVMKMKLVNNNHIHVPKYKVFNWNEYNLLGDRYIKVTVRLCTLPNGYYYVKYLLLINLTGSI